MMGGDIVRRELRIITLGQPHIYLDQDLVSQLIYNKSTAMLIFLAVTKMPHSRQMLSGLLWGELKQENAYAGLRKVVADLRRVLEKYLLIERDEVAFDLTTAFSLDVDDLRQAGRLCQRKIKTLAAKEADLMRSAVESYRGDFLEGFSLSGAPDYEEWVRQERDALRFTQSCLLYTLAKYHTASGEYIPALTYSKKLLNLNEIDEAAHRLMMRLLAARGQRSSALLQFQQCQAILRDQLGVEPSVRTQLLYEQIRDGGFDLSEDCSE